MHESIGIQDVALTKAAERLLKHAQASPEGFTKDLATMCADSVMKLVGGSIGQPLPFFQDRYSTQFKEYIHGISDGNDVEADALFWIAFYLYSIFLEHSLRSNNYSPAEAKIHAFFDEHLLAFPSETRMRIVYLRSKLPHDIFLHTGRTALAELEQAFQKQLIAISEPATKVDGWNARLSKWDSRVNEIEAGIKGHTEKLNFVGLSKAFTLQVSAKLWEKRIQALLLTCTGLLLVTLPFAPIFAGPFIGISISWTLDALPKLIPFAVSELVLLYIFRVFLRNHMSAKAQLVQLELRQSLCAFVQSYAEFVAPLRKGGDPKVLERFEALIFSGISPDPQNVPSQFDGLEAVVQAVKEIKGPT